MRLISTLWTIQYATSLWSSHAHSLVPDCFDVWGWAKNSLVTVAHIRKPQPECWQSQSNHFAQHKHQLFTFFQTFLQNKGLNLVLGRALKHYKYCLLLALWKRWQRTIMIENIVNYASWNGWILEEDSLLRYYGFNLCPSQLLQAIQTGITTSLAHHNSVM